MSFRPRRPPAMTRRGSSVDPPSATTASGHSSHSPTNAWTSTAAKIMTAATMRSSHAQLREGEWSCDGCGRPGWQIRHETLYLVAVATTEHSVDAQHAFFEAQAALSDRLRDEVRGFVSLAVRCEHWR